MTATVTIWSDVHCPWAAVATHRLRRAREAHGLDVVFDQRPWPLELVNGTGIPYPIISQETAVLANHEPELFSSFRGDSKPSTAMPAFELIAAARRVHGARAAEEVDYHVRLAFFRDSVDFSVRAGLEAILAAAGRDHADLDAAEVMAVWDAGAVRADVLADYAQSKSLPIQGSPQIFWPDGETTHNPGMTDHTWVRGIPRIGSTDPAEPGRLLRSKVDAAG